MSDYRDLLVEIGTEELPPKALPRLIGAFKHAFGEGLRKADLSFQDVREFATPRRLALLVTRVTTQQTQRHIERRGPALTASFDENGMPTGAALGFARSCGVDVDVLERMETENGAWLVYRATKPGQPAQKLIPKILSTALEQLPIPKRMRWGDSAAEFVRPVQWLVLLLGDEVIEAELLGVRAGRETYGHRFHHPGKLYLSEPAAFAPLLETEGRVLPDFAVRREAIYAQITEAGVSAGGQVVVDGDLLDEVTALVEWPATIIGQFDPRFLAIPEAALISTMQEHQRYFPVRGNDGKLLPCFITVANIESRDPQAVQQGNERVIRPRLEDAMFFYERDLALPLERRLEGLKSVVFQKQLGSLYDKVQRVQTLTERVARALGCCGESLGVAVRAAVLCKCDLMTEMVGEFPELQGVMGLEYALKQGEHPNTAAAMDEQYLPRFAGDRLPETDAGRALAIADKLDTLCGIFRLGLIPTGEKDPFALRRAALGVLRIIIEDKLSLDLKALIEVACEPFAELAPVKKKEVNVSLAETAAQVFSYMMDRLRAYYADAGVTADEFEAVLQCQPTEPYDFDQRVRALKTFRTLPEAESLAAANKRIHNILRQVSETVPPAISVELLQDAAEQALASRVQALTAELAPLWADKNYEKALAKLASLREPVDCFFEQVMVMTEDERVRGNRLALLKAMNEMFLRVADFSRLQG